MTEHHDHLDLDSAPIAAAVFPGALLLSSRKTCASRRLPQTRTPLCEEHDTACKTSETDMGELPAFPFTRPPVKSGKSSEVNHGSGEGTAEVAMPLACLRDLQAEILAMCRKHSIARQHGLPRFANLAIWPHIRGIRDLLPEATDRLQDRLLCGENRLPLHHSLTWAGRISQRALRLKVIHAYVIIARQLSGPRWGEGAYSGRLMPYELILVSVEQVISHIRHSSKSEA